MTDDLEAGAVSIKTADATNTGPSARHSDTPGGEDVTERAEAVVKEARRRQRRRYLWFTAAASLVALATVGGSVAAGIFGKAASIGHGPARTSSSKGASTGVISREALQFRPSTAHAPLSPRKCSSKTTTMPPAGRAAWVRWLGGCAYDGPATLNIRTVQSVTAGYSCSGNVWVKVQLLPTDVGRFDRMVRREGASIIGSVLLDRQLSIYTGDLQHTSTALAGDVQLVGGLPAKSSLPHEIALALGQRLHWIPTARTVTINYC